MAVTLKNADVVAWKAWVQDFDKVYGMAQVNWAYLRRLENYVKTNQIAIYNKYSIAYNSGKVIMKQMNAAKKQRDIVAKWLLGLGKTLASTNAGTLDWLRNRYGLSGTLDYLGAAKKTKAVTVATALSVVVSNLEDAAKWVNATIKFNAQLGKLSGQAPPVTGAKTATGAAPATEPEPVTDTLIPDFTLPTTLFGIPIWYIVAGGAALLFVPRLLGGGRRYDEE